MESMGGKLLGIETSAESDLIMFWRPPLAARLALVSFAAPSLVGLQFFACSPYNVILCWKELVLVFPSHLSIGRLELPGLTLERVPLNISGDGSLSQAIISQSSVVYIGYACGTIET